MKGIHFERHSFRMFVSCVLSCMAFLGFLGLTTYTTSEVLGFAFVRSIVISFLHLCGFAGAPSFSDQSFMRYYCGRRRRHTAMHPPNFVSLRSTVLPASSRISSQ